jgi:AAA domain
MKAYSVDSFQGSEADIVIVSFVRANARASIGFVKVSNNSCFHYVCALLANMQEYATTSLQK